ncbi:MAG: ATP-dependent Clp protease ATP-binding subunit [Anaerolineae bacterium]|nr:ATP-dependent Clp protease ATP-binding subunit [Anaerolineae bacterium]
MSTLNPDIPSRELTAALNDAVTLLDLYDQRVLTPEVLLLTFLRAPTCAAAKILAHLAGTRSFDLNMLERQVESQARMRRGLDADFGFTDANNRAVPLSSEMLVVLDEGKTIAEAMGEVWVGTEHALAAMSQAGVSTAGLLQRHGITPTALTKLLADQTLVRSSAGVDWVAQARGGDIEPVYFRESLLHELISLLSLSGERHTVLVGQPGVGKRSLVYSLALLIAEGRGPVGINSVIGVPEQALYDNAEAAIRAGLRKAQGGILFVPDIHRFFGGAIYAELPKGVPALQKAFLSADVTLIGTTTPEGYDTRLSKATAVTAHSRVLRVPPTQEAETVQILQTLRPSLENEYAIEIDAGSLPVAASLVRRYLTTEPLPGGAVHLLHRACALVRMSTQKNLGFGPQTSGDTILDQDDITLAASLMTGIPVTRLGADERSRYAHMVEHLQKRIIGQDEAILALSRAVKTARVGLKDPKRPIGSFLFMGPTGVGKSELAKVLAEFMFGSEDRLIAIDMSEYMDESAVNRLIGAPPGYVGYEGGGQLTDRLLASPYTVVLFDEVEKAHPRILDLLLQVLDEGRLTDGKGRQCSFGEAVILLTSNLGARYLGDPQLGEVARDQAMDAVRAHFRPEFLNRLDEIIFFNQLTDQDLLRILDLLLSREKVLASNRGLELAFTPVAQTWLLAQNDHPEWGARPLRRIIQRHVREPLANLLLTQDPSPGTTVHIDVQNHALSFSFDRIPPV